mmetsp:Transcript_10845/g.27278  ORF Transcript_10845/g.27278 Transcript_10845/m.27278 type:complete len:236 (+) Transcript_10845:96-803(+)
MACTGPRTPSPRRKLLLSLPACPAEPSPARSLPQPSLPPRLPPPPAPLLPLITNRKCTPRCSHSSCLPPASRRWRGSSSCSSSGSSTASCTSPRPRGRVIPQCTACPSLTRLPSSPTIARKSSAGLSSSWIPPLRLSVPPRAPPRTTSTRKLVWIRIWPRAPPRTRSPISTKSRPLPRRRTTPRARPLFISTAATRTPLFASKRSRACSRSLAATSFYCLTAALAVPLESRPSVE